MPVAAVVSLLVLALGVTGLFSLHLANARSAADLVGLDAIEHRLLVTLRARAAFKTQVQEWKNILLRGRDPADLAAYRARFEQEETAVREHLQTLENAPASEGAARAEAHRPADLLAEHRELGETYRAALAAADFTRADAPFRIDAAVRGKDRPLSDKLDALAAEVEQAASAELKAMGERAAARYEGLRRVTWIVAGLAMLASLWLCFRAARA